MKDYIVRATAAEASIRAFAVYSRETVETARQKHNTSPIATAALGRLLTAGAIMGTTMKGENDILTILIRSEGPLGGITVTADAKGNVKGYVANPEVILPANELGKLDIGKAVGPGILEVIKDLGLKEPYSGQVELQSGEIADDLTYYFAVSEQIPSSVGLGVLMNKDNTVKQAGGFLIQLMPFANDSVITKLEENLSKVRSVTSLLEDGSTPEQILQMLLEGLNPVIGDVSDIAYYCNCSKERVTKALLGVGKEELQDIIEAGETIEMNCHFCNTNYYFTVEEIRQLMREAEL